MTILAALAAGTNSSSTINDVEPGLLGFLVVAALGLALFFLLRSMNKQFRKIGPRPEDVEAEATDEAGGPGDGDGAGVTGEAGAIQFGVIRDGFIESEVIQDGFIQDGATQDGAAPGASTAGKTRAARPWEG